MRWLVSWVFALPSAFGLLSATQMRLSGFGEIIFAMETNVSAAFSLHALGGNKVDA